MKMHNPAHPGELLKYDIIEASGLSITNTANHLGISRKHLSNICNAHAPITADIAIRLEKAFGKPSAETWLSMQLQYELWHAQQANKSLKIDRIQAA